MKVRASAPALLPLEARHCQIAGKSLEPRLPSRRGNTVGGQGNDLGYGKNV